MKKWRVTITDGLNIDYNFPSVVAVGKYEALCTVLKTFNSNSYGMPYGIEKDGIKNVSVRRVTEGDE